MVKDSERAGRACFLALLVVAVGLGGCARSPVDAGRARGLVQLGPLTPTSSTLLIGNSRRFQPTVLDPEGRPISRAVVWSSSAPGIVSVDTDGVARAVAQGQAMIMESTADVATLADVNVPAPTGVATPAGSDIRAQPGALSLVTLRVPPGAVAGSTAITIVPVSPAYLDSVAPSPRLVVGTAHRLAPDGLHFAMPATLSITCDPVRLTAATPVDLLRLGELTDGSWRILADSRVDTTSFVVSGPIDSLAVYAVVAEQSTTSAALARR